MGVLSFCLFVFWVSQVVFAQQTTDPNEVDALNRLIDYWNLRDNLNITNDPCIQNAAWANKQANPRVACDCSNNTCHITHLKIHALDISGELPSELFVLKELMNLDFGKNVLNGAIPAEIERLSNMQHLDFGSNNFIGPLPTSLGKLTSLQELWASDNLFTGKLPDFFGTLTKLRNLRLQGTLLEGPIPSSFSALKKLGDLRIGDLNGEDSSLEFLRDQKSLTILILRNCLLSGQIPDQLGNFSQLQELDLSFNKLTGQIPDSFQDLASLQYLYLGSNNLNGQLPANIIGPNLIAIDVSFNPLSGNLPQNSMRVGLSMNAVGTSINANNLQGKASGMLQCLKADFKCSNKVPSKTFSVKCGGTDQTSASGIEYEGDLESMGAASLYTSSDNLWAVSNTGNFISNPNGQQYLTQTGSQITGTLDSELYKTARISPSSLRYYGLGLQNGRYSVELHFAEIGMDDSHSWKGLGRRLFDVYIQGEIVLKDFNIKNEAGGSKKALIKTFEANVTNTIMDIHFFWAGKGTCCIPYQGTYGPLVSAIHVSQVSDGAGSSKKDKKRVGKLVGISMACVAGLVIISSVFYLWWIKEDSSQHMRIYTGHPGND
uniref:non-specific serine/threonine protein kinase n=1 Tax=Populus alba TaxID=43335 RepID=A0A4U5QK79_POPAL|nr:putative LRR receptor-like serine/threonine-protein kinase [Populus alba]